MASTFKTTTEDGTSTIVINDASEALGLTVAGAPTEWITSATINSSTSSPTVTTTSGSVSPPSGSSSILVSGGSGTTAWVPLTSSSDDETLNEIKELLKEIKDLKKRGSYKQGRIDALKTIVESFDRFEKVTEVYKAIDEVRLELAKELENV